MMSADDETPTMRLTMRPCALQALYHPDHRTPVLTAMGNGTIFVDGGDRMAPTGGEGVATFFVG